MSDRGFGIEFGTTNSVVAVCNTNIQRIEKLTNPSTNLPHPSVVWYGLDRAPIVGEEAKRNILRYENAPSNQFVKSIKRRLGKDKGT